ncbi:XdhC family protein [Paenibacillus sp. P96]|uniref:XdhC family protein n=1 Tax=Paenibacillus zeirhizosphaerae TaxID=2987519 RepID=A0ABT9FVH5_9BACL|nr:XdhC family protein [Paenibacillus sp. P96]MDP4098723.1 XdhC family protein [Paenibacillus sp. P96]
MEMADLCAAVVNSPERKVLATVVYIDGHAYRKEGASMLLGERGSIWGSISPGCMESDLLGWAEAVLSTGKVERVPYDMRPEDDLSWGENIGCGGLLHIVLEPVTGKLEQVMQQMHYCFLEGQQVMLTRRYDWDNGTAEYVLGKAVSPQEAAAPWPVVYFHTYEPKPRLILVGAGEDAVPVSRLAAGAGFRVTVADWREALMTAERFPGAELVYGFPSEIFALLNIRSSDYVLLMSHQFQREKEFLALLQAAEYAYLGIMGSKDRTTRLTEGLIITANLHSPVGLAIGADGPEEIAVSITAELIALRRGKQLEQPKGGARYERSRNSARGWTKRAHGT